MSLTKKAGYFQQQIKQSKPFGSLEAEAFVGLLILADGLRRDYAEVFEKAGVTTQQYNVLRILRGAGGDGMPIREIASRLIEKSPGITRFIDQLEKRRLIRRHRSIRDRRQIFCRITLSGLTLLRTLDQPVDEWDKQSLSMLNRKDLKQLIRLLERIHSFHAQRKERSHGRTHTGEQGRQDSGRARDRKIQDQSAGASYSSR